MTLIKYLDLRGNKREMTVSNGVADAVCKCFTKHGWIVLSVSQ